MHTHDAQAEIVSGGLHMHDAQAEIDAEFYTIEEVADVLGVSTDTIRRRIRSGQLQAVKRPADIPGHGQRWYIPKRALGMQEVTEVIQVPHALTLNDFDMMITTRLETILNERDERTVQVIRSELGATLEQALDEQLRSTNRRIEGLDRTIRALPAPATPETITELQTQVEAIKVELAGVKEAIDYAAQNAQTAADNVRALLPEEEKEKLSRWQRFKNRWSRKRSEEN
jgi:excisionase family DNA binding protein